MVAGLQNHQKTIGTKGCQTKNHCKTIAANGLPDQNHRKTIDINGCFPTIHSMAMVSMKTF